MPQGMCQFYNDFKGKVNTWQNGHFRPLSFIYAIHESQMEIFNENKALLGQNQIAEDNLRYFYKSVQFPLKDFPRGSLLPYPADYSMFSTLWFLTKKEGGQGIPCEGVEVFDKDKICRELREEEKADALSAEQAIENDIKKVNGAKWAAVNKHASKSPSLTEPYCTQNSDGFKVSPQGLGWVVFNYLSIPQRPVMKYHFDARHNFFCDPGGTDILWGDELLPELMSRVKTKYASYVSDVNKYQEGTKETELAS